MKYIVMYNQKRSKDFYITDYKNEKIFDSTLNIKHAQKMSLLYAMMVYNLCEKEYHYWKFFIKVDE